MADKPATLLDEMLARYAEMPPDQQIELAKMALAGTADLESWVPQPGGQTKAYYSEADELFYGGSAGAGKLLRNTEPIPTPAGWTTMGALKIGDEIFDETGKVCNVVFISREEKTPEMYRITFDDGSFIDSCADHQWVTFDAKELGSLTKTDPAWRAARRASRPSRAGSIKSALFKSAICERNSSRDYGVIAPTGSIKTTRTIAASVHTKSGRKNHAIQVCGALDLQHVSLPVDPYTLGAWIGDGTSKSGGFTGIDSEITDRISNAGYIVTHSETDRQSHHIRGLIPALRKLGLRGNKHIPEIYLRSSVHQRLEILKGLMDTDGTVCKKGRVSFCNTNKRVIDGVYELITSLGWKVGISEGRSKLRGIDHGPKWVLHWTPDKTVFHLQRKADRQSLSVRRTTKFRYIVSCVPVPTSPGRCIQVNSPSRMYLAGRSFTPTHNTGLLIGLATTAHTNSLILRRENTQARAISDMIEESLGTTEGRTLSPVIQWRLKGRTIELGGCQLEKDKQKRKGIAHDGKFFDEITDFTKSQYVFIKTWTRSAVPGQRSRVVCTGNPPTSAEGLWVIEYWAPWLDPKFPNPATDGELRWVISDINGNDKWVDGPGEYTLTGDDGRTQTVTAKSRSFIRGWLKDNAYLSNTDYGSTLDALPLELRAAYRDGAFDKSLKDNAKQTIPTTWIMAAIERGRDNPKPPHGVPMCAIGVDPTGGGDDEFTLAPRYDGYYAPVEVTPAKEVPFGKDQAGKVVACRRHEALPIIDVGGGYGGPLCEKLTENGIKFYSYNGANKVSSRDKSGKLKFKNKRAETYWRFREALDPSQPGGSPITLPDDSKLLADLAAPTFEVTPQGIQIEDKGDIKVRLGRSPDRGDAVTMAWCEGAKISQLQGGDWAKYRNNGAGRQEKANMGHDARRRR